ncbi:DUF2267 domain-containing protein [Chitinispirillales bacterium ANBcel5]|uniref:DUF2267 domain-containing protein n=1 Tax=Cellulosispirillum alkaliphilum TaxID=3039283 RepID=UPI002A580216|nr:DUF2267 domain-containing protein [Chitinispirillales bacterium ANBcel5]
MEYVEFVDKVRKGAKLHSLHDAEVAVEASLATLGERLNTTDTTALGAQVPSELKHFLSERSRVDSFDLEEYYNRVSARADVGYPDAVQRSRKVMTVLKEAVTEGQINKVLEHLPAEFKELFGKEPQDPLSPTQQQGK